MYVQYIASGMYEHYMYSVTHSIPYMYYYFYYYYHRTVYICTVQSYSLLFLYLF